jgi:hypothetical protein
VSTGWATGGPATAAGLCETVTIDVLPCLLSGVLRADGTVAAQSQFRTSVAACSHTATNWTMIDFADNGLISREEDI